MIEKTFTPPALAKLWGVHSDKIRRWIEAGKLSASNLGEGESRPRWRITESAAAEFLASRQNKPTGGKRLFPKARTNYV